MQNPAAVKINGQPSQELVLNYDAKEYDFRSLIEEVLGHENLEVVI